MLFIDGAPLLSSSLCARSVAFITVTTLHAKSRRIPAATSPSGSTSLLPNVELSQLIIRRVEAYKLVSILLSFRSFFSFNFETPRSISLLRTSQSVLDSTAAFFHGRTSRVLILSLLATGPLSIFPSLPAFSHLSGAPVADDDQSCQTGTPDPACHPLHHHLLAHHG